MGDPQINPFDMVVIAIIAIVSVLIVAWLGDKFTTWYERRFHD